MQVFFFNPGISSNKFTIPLSLFFILFLAVSFPGIAQKRPNILFAISDDQSFFHTGFEGSGFVKTPAFDRVAQEGIYFKNVYAGSPGCAPSRSAIITGRHHWQNEQAGQHASAWLKKFIPFTDLLEQNGYVVGRTGKGVGPFQYARNEQDSLWRKNDVAGIEHTDIRYKPEDDERFAKGISPTNYFENFKAFVENNPQDQPFFFWYGGKEPHRSYEKGSWKKMGKKLEEVEVPAFLPDNDEIRGDLLDYAVEIEWFDLHLERMLNYLDEIGELENTLVIVTADNGMPFPRAKANSYEYGVHVPFAVRFPKEFPGNRVVEDAIGFADIAPTLLEISQTPSDGMLPISGKSFLDILKSKKEGQVSPDQRVAYSGRERHSSSRYLNWGYPQRAIRKGDYLLVWNMKSERWPSGAPQKFSSGDSTVLLPMYGLDDQNQYIPESAFTDIDDGPSKTFLIEHHADEDISPFFDLSMEKRPEFELFHVSEDPSCIQNLAEKPEYREVKIDLESELKSELTRSQDPRVIGPDKEIFDSYQRYFPIRKFPKPKNQ